MKKDNERKDGDIEKDRSKRKRTGPHMDYETEQCKVCKNWFKGGKGVKIHQKKSGCGGKKPNLQRKIYKSEVGSRKYSGTTPQ